MITRQGAPHVQPSPTLTMHYAHTLIQLTQQHAAMQTMKGEYSSPPH